MKFIIRSKILCLFLLICLIFISCNRERYRSDRKNRLTRKAKIASDYLANQAIELTQENIENRKETEKSARKKLSQQQKDLNEANATSSKVKKQKKHKGNFRFY